MALPTMAAVMTFVSGLEDRSAAFYEEKAAQFEDFKETFLRWSKENKKNEKNVKRTYFGVITDTIESNFSFEQLDDGAFALDLILPEGSGPADVKTRAAAIETVIRDFYLAAARSCEGLMADIPRLFKKMAKKRDERLQSLAAL